jgi:hypothetical protein
LAAVFPLCRFILVDYNEQACIIGRQRVVDAGLNNVEWVCSDVGRFTVPYDIGLATHLCGDATDVAMTACVAMGATFIATPCCLGKIAVAAGRRSTRARVDVCPPATPTLPPAPPPATAAATGAAPAATPAAVDVAVSTANGVEAVAPNSALPARAPHVTSSAARAPHVASSSARAPHVASSSAVVYPRSQWLRGVMDVADYLKVARASDGTSIDQATSSDMAALSGFAKELIDADRLGCVHSWVEFVFDTPSYAPRFCLGSYHVIRVNVCLGSYHVIRVNVCLGS